MQPQEREEFVSDKNEWTQLFNELGIKLSADYVWNRPDAPRYLVMCRGGNTRSVAAAMLLKYKYGCDALACSYEKNDISTLMMLVQWAQFILVFEPEHLELMHGQLHRKDAVMLDIGHLARLRAHPFDINFLKELEPLLEGVINGKPKSE